ncbi:MAG: energy-coupling factor transporter ATPase [Bacilli bacterium]|jgi:energy-coupling factor transport system ATP-binding protein|nr:energy-coupling factor transporter ATPase [Bacilli bacterium]
MKVSFKNVSFKYDEDSVVLKDFNLTINSGEMVAILGHNGSGKSTIAKIIMGLLEINSGEIYINDRLLNQDTIEECRNHMSIIFQNPDNQFVGVTVKDDIAFGLENKNVSREEMIKRINEYLKLVSMEEFIDRSPEELSGGQKQRVAIAGALAMETELMIFDESTSMLDPKGTKEVNQMIKQIKNDQNKTIIVITHNLEEASYADRVIVLNAGEIVADGTPMEVFKQEEVLEESGLKTMDSVSLIHNLKNKQFKNKKEIEEALWELTFNE